MEEKMRLTKQLMDECLKLYDKHFPTEENAPLKEKKQVVRFIWKLNNFTNKHKMKLTKEHIEILQGK